MIRNFTQIQHGWMSAALALTLGVALAQTAGCIWSPRPPKPEIDLFDPAIMAHLIKEPLIIAGLVLYLEVTAGGQHVVPPGNKIVSLRNDITVPIVGEVDCTGLTLRQLSEKLTEAFAVYYNNPSVTVTFVQNEATSPWGTVGVYGCVGREGRVNIPATSQLSLTHAIQQAGGLTPLANRKRVQVTRTATPKDLPQLDITVTQSREFSYDDISNGRIQDPPLIKDDVVRVWETFF